jgi:hypothetical protein
MIKTLQIFFGKDGINKISFTDLGPFRAIRVDALQRMAMSNPTFGWIVEMQIKAAKLQLKSTELPVSYLKRIGTSKVTGTVRGTVNDG